MAISKNESLTPKEKTLLIQLAEYRFLTARQLSVINDVGLRATQKNLKSLNEKGFLQQSNPNFSSLKGRPET